MRRAAASSQIVAGRPRSADLIQGVAQHSVSPTEFWYSSATAQRCSSGSRIRTAEVSRYEHNDHSSIGSRCRNNVFQAGACADAHTDVKGADEGDDHSETGIRVGDDVQTHDGTDKQACCDDAAENSHCGHYVAFMEMSCMVFWVGWCALFADIMHWRI